MKIFIRLFYFLILIATFCIPCASFAKEKLNIPILCYHNFNPTVPGLMNLTPKKFENQLRWIKDNGFTVISLKDAVDYLQGNRKSLPPKPVVITVDDGWESAYVYVFPIALKYHVPVTLFVYTETISKGKHNLTWEQLKEMQQTGLIDIEGHTYSHPNFNDEKAGSSPAKYEKIVEHELVTSKKILEDHLGSKVNFLAWPFGIYDDYLEHEAEKAGYTMAFSIDARTANRDYNPMSQPRYMILDHHSMSTFESIVNGTRNKVR